MKENKKRKDATFSFFQPVLFVVVSQLRRRDIQCVKMKEKDLKVVITYQTTTDAMAMEKMSKKIEISGRLIPVPRQLSAGCGLAWCAKVEERGKLLGFIHEEKLNYDHVYEICL